MSFSPFFLTVKCFMCSNAIFLPVAFFSPFLLLQVFIPIFIKLRLFCPHFISQFLTWWKEEACILLHMHFAHLELQIQFPSLPQYVAATVMGFMVTFHGTYLLFPTAYFFFNVCSSLIQRNWNHLENVVGFFLCTPYVFFPLLCAIISIFTIYRVY